MAARVARMFETTYGNHVVYLNGFNPETDEVIVVKKDAARVWVDKGKEDYCVHFERPSFDDSLQEWDSCDGLLVSSRDEAFHGIGSNDCVEFIAAKTHRPPVAEPVAELSDEAKVKAVYPKAYHAVSGNIWEEDSATARQLSLQFARADLAWADAARRLNAETKPESISHHNFGCGVNVVSGAVLAN